MSSLYTAVRGGLSFGPRARRAPFQRQKAIGGGSKVGKSEELPSLIPTTLEEMSRDKDFQRNLKNLKELGQAELTREEKLRRQRSLDNLGTPSFQKMMRDNGAKPLLRDPAKIFQLNIGLYCNQACTHCHVESSPKRTEMMDRKTAQKCIDLLYASDSVEVLDITGGAPELNKEFRFLVESASEAGVEIIDRCNLTVLLEPGQEDLIDFLVKHKVRVVASLPCYSAENVDQQRGHGVFDRSIKGLQLLNEAGYGKEGTGLYLDLVYNPNGDFLAPSQETLEQAYKDELKEAYGIVFNNLFCLNNMPIKRFADYLSRRGKLMDYMQLLLDNFNVAAADGLMCRDTVSIGWDGRIYDCDFNQQLDIGVLNPGGGGLSVFDINGLEDLTGWAVAYDNHCFGCTAGSGSSCQGSTV